MNKRKGFSIIEGIIIVVVVAIIVSLGLVFYNNYVAKKDATTTEQESQVDVTQDEPTQISSSSDLDTAADQLDQLDIEDTDDVSTLDAETEDF